MHGQGLFCLSQMTNKDSGQADASVSGSAVPGQSLQTMKKAPKKFHNTKVCKFFFQGLCKQGQHCTFSHEGPLESASGAELKSPCWEVKIKQPSTTQRLYKTEMCKFCASNLCGRGDLCTFAHSESELLPKPYGHSSDEYHTLVGGGEAESMFSSHKGVSGFGRESSSVCSGAYPFDMLQLSVQEAVVITNISSLDDFSALFLV